MGANVTCKTPERLALCAELWPLEMPTDEIVRRVNAMAGHPAHAGLLRWWMAEMKIARPKDYMALERKRKRQEHLEVKWDENKPESWRRFVFDPAWPPAQIRMAIDLWNERPMIPSQQVAFLMRTTKSSLTGKMRRLKAKGYAVMERESPLIRTEDDPRRNPGARRHVATKSPPRSKEKEVRMVVTKPPRPPKVRMSRAAPTVRPEKAATALPVTPYTKGHREMPFRVGAIGDYIYRIKKPAPGRCTWPLGRCDNPTEGGICDVHQALIRKAA